MQNNILRVLALGDVVGKSGVSRVASELGGLKKSLLADLVCINGENASDSNGIDLQSAKTLFECGADVVTGGNHTVALREIHPFLEENDRFLRPANFPPGCPGKGVTLVDGAPGIKVLVMNLAGQVFMPPCDNPFVCAERLLKEYEGKYDFAVCDLHAEATSEKTAFGLWFDGKITCVYGTHTHVPTADEIILKGGTGYISDIGMCGVRESTVLGVKAETVLKQFVTGVHERFERIAGRAEINGVLFCLDLLTKRCVEIKRVKCI